MLLDARYRGNSVVSQELVSDDGKVNTPEPSHPTGPYFMRNLALFAEQASDLPELAQAVKALTLFNAIALMKTDFPFDTTFPNELAGAACMARGGRQLDAAMVLVSYGFHAEVRSVLRGVYESVGLGRLFAKDLENSAERVTKWIAEGTWWPDRVVRRWLEATRFVDESDVEKYRNYYSESSDWAHPTRRSCMDLFIPSEGGMTLISDPEFDLDATRETIAEITYAAVFACFALRKAIANEAILPPPWRKDLYELMVELAGKALPHLDRDWPTEQARYDAIVAKLQSMEDLGAVLQADPRSATNLTIDSDQGEQQ